MQRLLIACLLLLSTPVLAQVTIDGLPPVPVFPLPDAAGQNLWMTQGGHDYRITPFQAGSPFQGPNPPATPFINQLWWKTSPPPAQLLSWNGTNWVPFSSGVLNVTGFGVAGDGTDVSAALQALLNNTDIQGCLYFPAVTPGYALANAVNVPVGTCLVGDPGGARIFALPTNHTGLIHLAPNANIRVTDIFLDGSRASGASGDCIGTDPTIGAVGMFLTNVTIRNCAGSGVFLGGSSTPSRNVQISNGFISLNGVGITAQYLTTFNVTGNRIQNNDGPGITCGANGVGYCQSGAISGINIFSANGCINNTDNVSGQLEAISDVTISNNISMSSCGEGIQFGGARTTISGNHLMGNAQNGIFVQSVRKYSTGTISVANGATAVTGIGTGWAGLCPDIQRGFISNTGTRLQTTAPPGNAVTGGGSVSGVQVKSIDSNTALTLSIPWSGSSQVNAPYTIRCPVPAISPVIAANTVQRDLS
jgi:hypothetical protein